MFKNIGTGSLVLLLLIFVEKSIGESSSNYTEEEIKLLRELRVRVQNGFTQSYMNDDYYLIRFLRYKKNDINAAETMIKNNLAWRKEFKADEIFNETWTKWEKILPVYFSESINGTPNIVLMRLRELSFKRLSISNNLKDIFRYAVFVQDTLFKYNSIRIKGNYTQHKVFGGDIIFNAAGFDMRTHMCPQCIPRILTILKDYLTQYPSTVFRFTSINTPKLLVRAAQAIQLKKYLPLDALPLVKVYGFDKSEWGPELLKIYNKDQLTTEFGGSGKSVILMSKLKEIISTM